MQKNPCRGYSRHLIVSCKYGVISPTRKLNAQFVAVESETPLARTVSGMIYRAECKVNAMSVLWVEDANFKQFRTSGGYSQGMGPQLKMAVLV